jgi:Rrf2 family transcriptional regulator, nitric oxide-sensitive transcriptional repressor
VFSQTTEYALRAMACLALTGNQRVSSGALAERTQAPPDYLSKVLQSLTAAGLVDGRRGVGGGYRMAHEPGDVQLLEIINAVSPLERITTCPLGLKTHGSNLCPLHRKMDEAVAAVTRIFENVTLADLLNQPGANTPLCETRASASLTVGGRANGTASAGRKKAR